MLSVAAFAQGEFAFAGAGARSVWNVFNSSGTAYTSNNISCAFLFGTGTPLVDSIYSKTTTNGSTTMSSAQVQAAWTAILTDSSFMLASNYANSTLAVATSSSTGVYAYTPPGGSAGGAFAVSGSASGGATYNVFVIGWDSQYASPQAAAAAGSAVGWSQTFSYVSPNGPNSPPAGTPGTFLSAVTAQYGNNNALQFGVYGVSAVPEPGTMALAALGGASLLLFRRRK